MSKRLVLLCMLLLWAGAGAAQPDAVPSWSLELKGGRFEPDLDGWAEFYGSDDTRHLAVALAYKFTRRIEVGLEGGYIRDEGVGQLPFNGTTGGTVTYRAYPLSLFVLARGVFDEDQWLVPYAGAGYTRLFYEQEIRDQDTVRGATNGYIARVGVQLLLDRLDPIAASALLASTGVNNTYLFLEAQYLNAEAGTPAVELGGRSYLAGVLFEF